MQFPQGITLSDLQSMSPAEARKMIARDALLWLEMPQIEPCHRVYGLLIRDWSKDEPVGADLFFSEENRDARDHLLSVPDNEPCGLCAIGLGALAAVARFDAVQVNDVRWGSEMKRYLARFFSLHLIAQMEDLFEGWNLFTGKVEQKLPSARERLVFIFQTIANHETGSPDLHEELLKYGS